MDKQKALAVADTAIELIKGGWCQGAMARTKDGREVNEASNDAKSFCLRGAHRRASAMNGMLICNDFLWALSKAIGGVRSVADFNDAEGRTKAEVLKVLRKARKILEG